MRSNSEKLRLFRESIERRAQEETEELDRQIEAYRSRELERVEDSALSDAYHTIQRQVGALSSETATAVSHRRNELRRELFALREQYQEEVFAEAARRLLQFAGSAAYGPFLRQKVELLAQRFPLPGSVLLVREADLSRAAELAEIYQNGCRVAADPSILLGGVRLQNLEHGVIEDETLDTLLEDQKPYFHKHTEFHIDML